MLCSNWAEVVGAIYLYPDGEWKFPEEHLSWMGDDYEVKTYGFVCNIHGNWFRYECPHCLRKTVDTNNLLKVDFLPYAGQCINVEDQMALVVGKYLWAIRDHQFKFKIGEI